jgi:hypothetical protein
MAWKEASFENESGKPSHLILLINSYWEENTISALMIMSLIAWSGTWDTSAKKMYINECALTVLSQLVFTAMT